MEFSVPKSLIFSIEVPGTVKNIHRVTEALGGPKKLQDVLEGREILTLDFSGGNPFAKLLDGTTVGSKKLILKLKKRKHRDGTKTIESAECIGRVDHCGTFEQLCDFNVVPPPSAYDDAYNLVSFVRDPENAPKGPLFFPPTRYIRPQSNQVWTFSTIGATKQHARFRALDSSIDSIVSASSAAPSVWRFRDIEVPSSIKSAPTLSSSSLDAQLSELIVKLFNQQPLWQRSTIEVKVSEAAVEKGVTWTAWQLRKALARNCFCSLDGPWRGALVQVGYDPRKDSSSRFFQTIDFRDPHFRSAAFLLGTLNPNASSTAITTADATSGLSRSGPVVRRPSVRSQMTLFMLSELDDAGLQRRLASSPFADECTEMYGWWLPETLNEVRRHLTLKAQRVRVSRINRGKQQIAGQQALT